MKRFSDPNDDFLLAISEAGKPGYLVTGDKDGLLTRHRHKSTFVSLSA